MHEGMDEWLHGCMVAWFQGCWQGLKVRSLGRILKERSLVISHLSLGRGFGRQKTEDRGQKTEDRGQKMEDRRKMIERRRKEDCDGRGNPAPTLTLKTRVATGTIRGLFIFVKVGARSPRPLSPSPHLPISPSPQFRVFRVFRVFRGSRTTMPLDLKNLSI